MGVATNQAYPVIIRWDLKLFQYLIEAGQGKSLKEEKTVCGQKNRRTQGMVGLGRDGDLREMTSMSPVNGPTPTDGLPWVLKPRTHIYHNSV